MRFHVDLQGATGVAGHDLVDDAVAPPALARELLADPEEPRLTVGQGAEGLPDDERAGAAPPDEPLDRAVGVDEAAGARSGRGRPADGHDGGQGVRAAGPIELDRPFEERDRRGHRAGLVVPGRGYAVTPFSRRIAHTFWRGDRDVDMADAEMPQRVDDGVGDRRRRADRGRLADPLRPDRMVRRRGGRLVGLPGRGLDGRREEVVHERPGQVVAQLVVADLLVERRRETHRQAAVDLAVDDHRVDDVAAVVDRHEAADVDLAGPLVDVDDADVARRTGRSGSAGRSSRPPRAPSPSRPGSSCRPRRRSPGSS